MDLPASVHLREVAPRDGFQSLSRVLKTEEKVRIIAALIRAGVRELETTSFVHPHAVPQLADAPVLMAQVPRAGVTHAALVPNLTGAKRAVAAAVDQVVVVISASETHNRANVHSSTAASVAELDDIFALTRGPGVGVMGAIAVAFGCPYEGDVSLAHVLRLAAAFDAHRAAGVILADTAGMATPKQVDTVVKSFRDHFPRLRLGLHFHNNRGTAMANLLAALLAGADLFDTALAGIGGCPNIPQAAGNLPSEDVACMLAAMGVATGVDVDAVLEAARLLEALVGCTLPGQVLRSGPRLAQHAAAVCGKRTW
jgi:hydroxymethylglutaryl-CoA lyase